MLSNAKCVKESGLIAQQVFYEAPELRHLVSIPEGADSNLLYSSNVDLSTTDPNIDPDYTNLGWGSNLAAVNYNGIIPYLVRALQEKDSEIQDLKTRMSNLESKP